MAGSSSATSRILAVANQKGGVGKTTTAVNTAACLAEAGQRVLLVDCDPQANASSGLGHVAAADQVTLYDALVDGVALDRVVTPTETPGLDLVPGDADLAGAVVEMGQAADRDHRLARALAPVRDRYSWIFLDCPPSLGLLTINALVAADAVIVPVQTEYYALEGLAQLMESIELVRARLNPGLRVAGMLLTMVDGRTNLSLEVGREVRRVFGELTYRTVVPRNVRLSEAPSHGTPITRYDPRSSGADAYFDFAAEVAERA